MNSPRLPRPKRALRPSFVQTVASAATLTGATLVALVACGGSVSPGSSGRNPPTGYDECPTPIPGPGYPSPGATYPDGGYVPASGSACNVDPTKKCSFTVGPENCPISLEIACTNGKWEQWAASCNPPALQACPQESPKIGASCTNQASPCIYRGTCGTDSAYECTSGTWQGAKRTGGPRPACPTTLPAQGSHCTADCTAVPNGECSYPTSDACMPNRAQCVEDQWQILQVSCNPPPMDGGAGPDAAPAPDAAMAP